MTERQVGGGTEGWGDEKWTAAMKQEAKKRMKERQTDKPITHHSGDHEFTWQQIRKERVKDFRNEQEQSRKKQTKKPDRN